MALREELKYTASCAMPSALKRYIRATRANSTPSGPSHTWAWPLTLACSASVKRPLGALPPPSAMPTSSSAFTGVVNVRESGCTATASADWGRPLSSTAASACSISSVSAFSESRFSPMMAQS